MTDRPIAFKDPMMQALLAGRKTQDRQVLKPQPSVLNGGKPINNGRGSYATGFAWKLYPYAPGDRLWVKENCAIWDGKHSDVIYRADMIQADWNNVKHDASSAPWKLRSSMFMPRWASRLTLTVKGVKVQRLQEISEDDAIAEGIKPHGGLFLGSGSQSDIWMSPINSFQSLWNSIHGPKPRKRAGGTLPPRPSPDFTWDANPWVSALTFTVERRNIDQ